MDREQLRFKCPVTIDFIQGKKVYAALTRDNGATIETGIGEIQYSQDSAGMCLVWLQFRDDVKQGWVRLYLNEERIEQLNKVDNDQYDFEIASVLVMGQQIGK